MRRIRRRQFRPPRQETLLQPAVLVLFLMAGFNAAQFVKNTVIQWTRLGEVVMDRRLARRLRNCIERLNYMFALVQTVSGGVSGSGVVVVLEQLLPISEEWESVRAFVEEYIAHYEALRGTTYNSSTRN